MKKSSFTALLMGTASGILFALGMCMALLPEWNSFTEGILLGIAGLILALTTLLVWRRMEGRPLPRPTRRQLLLFAYVLADILILGTGMCLCLVWQRFLWGVLLGLFGMLMLIALIPMIKGLK